MTKKYIIEINKNVNDLNLVDPSLITMDVNKNSKISLDRSRLDFDSQYNF